MATRLRNSGLDILGDLPWGTHCCHFFQGKQDLLDTLLPYFKAGLQSREYCLWVTHEPVSEKEARRALRRHVPDADRYLANRSIEISRAGSGTWKEASRSGASLASGEDKAQDALAQGYAGLRANGNVAWLRRKDWRRFMSYEQSLNAVLAGKPMIILCSYPLERSRAADVLDVARAHEFAVARRVGNWEVLQWRPVPSTPDPYETLTDREREVFSLAVEGRSNPEIGGHLSISVRTAESHRASILRKLGLRNQTDLVLYAHRRAPRYSAQTLR
jgi:DNA-binding CsgD family transcriptional regulator